MDEAAAAAIKEDGAERKPRDGDTAPEHNVGPSAEDTADVEQCSIACKDCGLKFTHQDVFNTHLHQHALEEEGEEAQAGDGVNPAAELDSGRVDDGKNRGEDAGGDADRCDTSSSLQTNPSGLTQGDGAATSSVTKQLGKAHTCLICGKVYTYLVSFRKHQQLHEDELSATKIPVSSVHNLSKYQCPHCGMLFIRRARLLGHLKVHRPFKSKRFRCEQCSKNFISMKAWVAHVDLHKRKPFQCLTCAKNFTDEGSLHQHLRRHYVRVYTCNICNKSFSISKQFKIHYNTHTGAKPYEGTFCGQSFSQPGNLISHRKKHLSVYVGSSGMPLEIKNSAIMAKKREIKKRRLILAGVKEEPEMDTSTEELPGEEDGMEKIETQMPFEDIESGDSATSEESDCDEPVHHLGLSDPPGSAGSDPPDEWKSETVQPQTGQEPDESESQECAESGEHKYWEWECVECDMGFDEVAELHSHYIKHATGELPILQDE